MCSPSPLIGLNPLVIFAIFGYGIIGFIPPTPRNNTTGAYLSACPGSRFMHGGSTAFVMNDFDMECSNCFTLPERTYHPNRNCFYSEPVNCTPSAFVNRCYPPGTCPQGFDWYSTTFNVRGYRNGNLVHIRGVCCR